MELLGVVVLVGVIILLMRTSSLQQQVQELKSENEKLPKLASHATQWAMRWASEGRAPPSSLGLDSVSACGAAIGGLEVLTQNADEASCPRCQVLWRDALREGEARKKRGPDANEPTYHTSPFHLEVWEKAVKGVQLTAEEVRRHSDKTAACGALLGPKDLLHEATDKPTCPRCIELLATSRLKPKR